MIIRSRIVLPIVGAPIENGAVLVSGHQITSVGKWPALRKETVGKVVDLGETILLPGLINAHCHLDYTDMAGLLTPSGSFTGWIKGILALKAGWSYSDYAASWVKGAEMLARSGTTTVLDIEAVPDLLPEVWSSSALRVASFLELASVRSGKSAEDVVHAAVARIDDLYHQRNRSFLSPHALYSTTPALLKLSHGISCANDWPITMHVAESSEEKEMFQHREGRLFDWLKSQRDMSDCIGLSPVQMLAAAGALSPRFIAVHVNYLRAGDAALLAENRGSVVHCPRSHAFFGHAAFPFDELSANGVNLCLGTDSLATVRVPPMGSCGLSMFAEMNQFAEARPEVKPSTILEMATVNGAKALGNPRIGRLVPGVFADLIAIPFSGSIGEAEPAVVHNQEPVSSSMIDGGWVLKGRCNPQQNA